MKIFSALNNKAALRMAAVTGLGLALSGCAYGLNDGYGYDAGYADYQCDPYNEFDNYYDCDNSYGFVNIGFGGGWYDNFYYPGYGFYIFDTYGRRFDMQNRYRRYWAQRRYDWYRGRRDGRRGYARGGRRHNGDGYRGQGRYRDGSRRGDGTRANRRRDNDDNVRRSVLGRNAVPEGEARRGRGQGGDNAGARRGRGGDNVGARRGRNADARRGNRGSNRSATPPRRPANTARGNNGGTRAAAPNSRPAPAAARPAARPAPRPAARSTPRQRPATRPSPRRSDNRNRHPD